MQMIKLSWEAYERVVLPPDAPKVQRDECRKAFYSGAMTLFSGIMTMLEPGHDATENDLNRMSAINAELMAFGAEIAEQALDAKMREMGKEN